MTLRSRWLRTDRMVCRPPALPEPSSCSASPRALSAAARRAVRTAAGVGPSSGMRTCRRAVDDLRTTGWEAGCHKKHGCQLEVQQNAGTQQQA